MNIYPDTGAVLFSLAVILTMFATMTFDPRLTWDCGNETIKKSRKVTENNHSIADVEKIKRRSPVWIIPIVTALIGAWILFYHFSHQGPVATLVTTRAE